MKRLIERSSKVSKLRDLYWKQSNQIANQFHRRRSSSADEGLSNFKAIRWFGVRGFATSRERMIRCLIGYWNGPWYIEMKSILDISKYTTLLLRVHFRANRTFEDTCEVRGMRNYPVHPGKRGKKNIIERPEQCNKTRATFTCLLLLASALLE